MAFDLRQAGDAVTLQATKQRRAQRLERYIGVIYRPETERWSHYSHASLPDRYQAFVWFNETTAVIPLPTETTGGEDETFRFGF